MKKAIITAMTIFIIVGTIMVVFDIAFRTDPIYIKRYPVQGTNMLLYTIDVKRYLQNIQMSITNMSVLQLELPTLEWKEIHNTIIENQFWEDLGQDLAVILNYIIVGLNVMLYPFRIGGYLLTQICAIIGLNMINPNDNGDITWLVKFAQTITTMQIPYIA